MYYRFILPLTLLLLACNGKEKQKEENEDEQYAKIEQQDEKTIVKVQVAREDRFNLELVSNGKAEANRKAALNFEVADVVRKVNVKNGDRVKKGDIILRIEASYRCLLLGERRYYCRSRRRKGQVCAGRCSFVLTESLPRFKTGHHK